MAAASRTQFRRSCVMLAAAVVLAACGGSDAAEEPGVASVDDLATTTTLPAVEESAVAAVDDEPTSTTAAETAEEEEEAEEEMSPIEEQELALLDFSACIRDEGLDGFPDVTVDNNGAIDVSTILQSGVNIQSAEFTDAVEVCSVNVENITFSAAALPDPAQIVEQLFTFTECLRSEGIDAGDVAVTELLSRQSNVPEGVSGSEGIAHFFEVDPDDPAVIAAIEVCDELLVGLPGT